MILIVGILWAKGLSFGKEQQTLIAKFSDAGGAEIGDPVFVRGIKCGRIQDVRVNQRGDVIMDIYLDQKISLRHDASATIMMLEVMGGKKIEISPGLSEQLFNEATDTIQGSSSGDLSTLVVMMNSMSESIHSIVGKTDSLFTSLHDILGDPKVRADMKGILSEARIAVKDVNMTLSSVRSLIGENRESLKNSIAELEKLFASMNTSVREITPAAQAAISDTRAFISQASETMKKADNALLELDTMLADSRKNKSILYRLTTDKELGERLDSTLINAQKLIKEIRMQGLNANVRFFQSSDPLP